MAFLRETEIRKRARHRAQFEGLSIEEALIRVSRIQRKHYDIFLSQTIQDAEIVLGVYDLLTDMGYGVFCDWINAPGVNRDDVTPANAKFIRNIMSISDTMLFLDTENADQSFWMCWELGWFDGAIGPVGILPVLSENESYYRGREFLGLYPCAEIDDDGRLKVVRPVVIGRNGIMIFEAPNSRSFDSWREGDRDYMRPRVF